MNERMGRNEPCDCGSGKKYKKCCLLKDSPNVIAVDIEWKKLRKLEGRVVDDHLLPYITKYFTKDTFQEAVNDFYPDEGVSDDIDGENVFKNTLMPWLLFNWLPDNGFGVDGFDDNKTVAENYICRHEARLRNDEKQFISLMSKTYYSFYRVTDVELNESLTVVDILLNEEYQVKEYSATKTLTPGSILLSRILTFNEQSIFVGMMPYNLPFGFESHIMDFKDWLKEENKQLTPEILRDEYQHAIFDYFFKLLEQGFDARTPTLQNTDGEHMLFSKSHFTLKVAPEAAVERLIPLTLPDNLDELLEKAEYDSQHNLVKIEFPWLKKGNHRHAGMQNTVLGHLTLTPERLTLETNSQERTEKGKALLAQYLGDAVTFKTTVLESQEQKLRSVKEGSSRISASDNEQAALLEAPEVQAQMAEMAKAHWQKWFDENIPMLNDETPKEAAKHPAGRERLDALFRYYEEMSKKQRKGDPFKPDISFLKKELGLLILC